MKSLWGEVALVNRIFRLATWKRGTVLGAVDILILLALFLSSVSILNAPSEPIIRMGILTVLYIIFMYAFDYYSPRQYDSSRYVYAAFLVVFFSVSLSVLLSYALFFRPVGRKILLLHSAFAFFYLLFRGKFLSGVKIYVQNRFFLAGLAEAELAPCIRKKLASHGTIIPGPEQPTVLQNNSQYNDFFIVEHMDSLNEDEIHHLLSEKLRGKPVFTMAGFYEHFFRQVAADLVESRFFFETTGFNRAMRRFPMAIKRIVDLLLSLTLFCLSSPVMLLTALLIRLESRGAALFRQSRTGLHGKPFTILKFRSMRDDAEKTGTPQWATEDDPRITRIGKLIRKLRIDELPQLINVIRGDMSFVGPRPERPEFDEKLKAQLPFYMFRYLVKPGITGWAQVNYGYGASVEDALEKLKYDLYYVKNISFLLDTEVFLKTVGTVFLAKGR